MKIFNNDEVEMKFLLFLIYLFIHPMLIYPAVG